MVKDAEMFAEQDKEIKDKIDARNQLENYVYQMKNTITDSDKLADKLDDDDKATIMDALEEHGDWLSSNGDADKEDFEDHLRDL